MGDLFRNTDRYAKLIADRIQAIKFTCPADFPLVIAQLEVLRTAIKDNTSLDGLKNAIDNTLDKILPQHTQIIHIFELIEDSEDPDDIMCYEFSDEEKLSFRNLVITQINGFIETWNNLSSNEINELIEKRKQAAKAHTDSLALREAKAKDLTVNLLSEEELDQVEEINNDNRLTRDQKISRTAKAPEVRFSIFLREYIDAIDQFMKQNEPNDPLGILPLFAEKLLEGMHQINFNTFDRLPVNFATLPVVADTLENLFLLLNSCGLTIDYLSSTDSAVIDDNIRKYLLDQGMVAAKTVFCFTDNPRDLFVALQVKQLLWNIENLKSVVDEAVIQTSRRGLLGDFRVLQSKLFSAEFACDSYDELEVVLKDLDTILEHLILPNSMDIGVLKNVPRTNLLLIAGTIYLSYGIEDGAYVNSFTSGLIDGGAKLEDLLQLSTDDTTKLCKDHKNIFAKCKQMGFKLQQLIRFENSHNNIFLEVATLDKLALVCHFFLLNQELIASLSIAETRQLLNDADYAPQLFNRTCKPFTDADLASGLIEAIGVFEARVNMFEQSKSLFHLHRLTEIPRELVPIFTGIGLNICQCRELYVALTEIAYTYNRYVTQDATLDQPIQYFPRVEYVKDGITTFFSATQAQAIITKLDELCYKLKELARHRFDWTNLIGERIRQLVSYVNKPERYIEKFSTYGNPILSDDIMQMGFELLIAEFEHNEKFSPLKSQIGAIKLASYLKDKLKPGFTSYTHDWQYKVHNWSQSITSDDLICSDEDCTKNSTARLANRLCQILRSTLRFSDQISTPSYVKTDDPRLNILSSFAAKLRFSKMKAKPEYLEILQNMRSKIGAFLIANFFATPRMQRPQFTPIHNHQQMRDLTAIVNQTNQKGKTPLFIAVESKYPEIIPYLLIAGADPHKAGSMEGKTPYQLAMETGQMRIIYDFTVIWPNVVPASTNNSPEQRTPQPSQTVRAKMLL